MDYHTRESCFELTGQKLFTSNAVLELLDNQIISFFSGQKSMSETSGLGCWHCSMKGISKSIVPCWRVRSLAILCAACILSLLQQRHISYQWVWNVWYTIHGIAGLHKRLLIGGMYLLRAQGCSLSSDCRDWVLNCGKKYSLVVVRPHNALLLILRHDCSGSQEMVRTSLDGPL